MKDPKTLTMSTGVAPPSHFPISPANTVSECPVTFKTSDHCFNKKLCELVFRGFKNKTNIVNF